MRVAAIDCGTNSIRLLIADIDGSNFREVVRDMEIVRLGQGVDQTGQFHPDAIARTLAAVDKFAAEIAKRGVEKIRFCATSATRDATNRHLFVDGVRQRLGIELEVISGDEEAALSFAGAIKDLAPSNGPFLVVDIGGGSTEFVFGTSTVEAARSVNIGCVRMTERHFASDPVTTAQLELARTDIQAAIAQAAAIVPITKAKTLVAVAGTATTVAAAALNLPEYDRYAIHLSRISAQQTHDAATMFATKTREQRLSLGYMHPGRVDVIAAGSLVLSEIMKATGAAEFVASESDILDGMAFSLARN
ncbi:MAG: exopolyphosphatase [Actinobacteria bacterium BACL15 MAG-120619-bin91]|jgi:exopolyphosphatase / guanosine-5'-triphosphate,3'-diphosphate pyrophosphatase|uniref:Exopolyphosphatase n=1 Tax=Actinobacteria bacterium BACL15 MAG-120619-bin91 TaxID=1655562 RepID=A0A0R2PC72_9ACTN|nr:MAG: exopolyphosphatase [Actinobacteria bacterium BACL15 MAG-120619-bin91]MDP5051823.1 Ppx/GppA family phosphatase [Candidatus Planktophila sp.]